MDIVHKIGRRKTAVARIYLSEGKGNITVNKKDYKSYFTTGTLQYKVQQPLMLTENLEVSISFYNEKPLTVELPNQVTCTIDTTDVALKGQTVSSSYKPATLDNGVNIQVPPFIESGDKIIVDTRTMEYVKKI